ncbi:hypothetical protein ACKXMJ_001338 [Neisseria gonorrhoeae]
MSAYFFFPIFLYRNKLSGGKNMSKSVFKSGLTMSAAITPYPVAKLSPSAL